jgi:hypothetical protein
MIGKTRFSNDISYCDLKLCFLDVFCGLLGSIQDKRLMRLSRFYTQVTDLQTRLKGEKVACKNDTYVGEYILADAGYPLYPWLIVLFLKGQLE